MTSDMQEIEDIFRFEAEDLLISLQEALLEMEGNLHDPLALEQQVKRAFRSLHTIKGSAGCIQLDRISHLAHSLENALNILRDASYCYSNIATLINILLQGTDRLQKFIAQPVLSDSNAMPVDDIEEQILGLMKQQSSIEEPKITSHSSQGQPGDIFFVTEQDDSPQTTPQEPPETPTSSVLPSPAPNGQKECSSRPLESLRIRVALLDELRRLASELVLVRNQHLASARQFPDFPRVISQRLDALASDLQESIMRMRLQPLSNIFNRFRRVVRDLNVSLGKDINLDIRGGDVELDNAILDSLGEPLMHLVRNCCDHGIEHPSQREACGKPRRGTLSIDAHNSGGQVVIIVEDDGGGMDVARIRRVAQEKHLKSESELAAMSNREILNLIFAPGFSTAKNVTDVSGRGVGMDVVQSIITGLGGHIEIDSILGKGSSFEMRLPLTLSIIPTLLVKISGVRYGIPQEHLVAIQRLYENDIHDSVQIGADCEFLRHRGQLVPLVRLPEALATNAPLDSRHRLEVAIEKRNNPTACAQLSVVILKLGRCRFAALVDEFLDTEETVVTPMHPLIQNIPLYSGSTILGDGQVALILDPVGIARHWGIEKILADEAAIEKTRLSATPAKLNEDLILLFSGPQGDCLAVPLGRVVRIECIEPIEANGLITGDFVLIRNDLVRVVDPTRPKSLSKQAANQCRFLIIPRENPSVGILTREVLGVYPNPHSGTDKDGVLDCNGYETYIVDGRITTFPDWEDLHNPPSQVNHEGGLLGAVA